MHLDKLKKQLRTEVEYKLKINPTKGLKVDQCLKSQIVKIMIKAILKEN